LVQTGFFGFQTGLVKYVGAWWKVIMGKYTWSCINLSFLDPGKKNIATCYADAKNAHYEPNPQAYTIRKINVTRKTKLEQYCAPSGGYAFSVVEAR
jgi:hypothetical protein